MNGYLLDTHVWIWTMQEAVQETTAGFFAEAEEWQRQGLAHLSPFSCWEISLLIKAKKLTLDDDVQNLWTRDTADGFQIAEVTANILIASTRLPGELHRDPVDRILAATAREHDLTLVTRDKALLQYARQGHVKARKP